MPSDPETASGTSATPPPDRNAPLCEFEDDDWWECGRCGQWWRDDCDYCPCQE